jgi:ATP-dependent Clp protease ATP-binding subunit ClpA
MDPLTIGGATLKILASAGAGKLAAVTFEQGTRKLFPSDLEKAIHAGLEAAQRLEDAPENPSSHVFYSCHASERTACLKQFVEHPTTVAELQKPLVDKGKPDVDCLRAAFEQVGDDLKLKLVKLSVPRWVETFAAVYFEQTAAAIRFQVAKGQYLKQLAQRVDDVKFVGIAVPGEEVEKQEVLAQIFVMPDVREEKSNLQRFSDTSELVNVLGEIKGGISYIKSIGAVRGHDRNVDYQAQLLEEQRSWAMRDRSSPRVPAQQVLNQTQKKAVLLGAPGSGKTMLVSYLALMLCEQAQSDPGHAGELFGVDAV